MSGMETLTKIREGYRMERPVTGKIVCSEDFYNIMEEVREEEEKPQHIVRSCRCQGCWWWYFKASQDLQTTHCLWMLFIVITTHTPEEARLQFHPHFFVCVSVCVCLACRCWPFFGHKLRRHQSLTPDTEKGRLVIYGEASILAGNQTRLDGQLWEWTGTSEGICFKWSESVCWGLLHVLTDHRLCVWLARYSRWTSLTRDHRRAVWSPLDGLVCMMMLPCYMVCLLRPGRQTVYYLFLYSRDYV